MREKKRYSGRCFGCGKYLPTDDKYCRFCGALIGKRDFSPDKNTGRCIYGPPPVERLHICSLCGYEWNTFEMTDNEKYCPKCGGSAPAQENVRQEHKVP